MGETVTSFEIDRERHIIKVEVGMSAVGQPIVGIRIYKKRKWPASNTQVERWSTRVNDKDDQTIESVVLKSLGRATNVVDRRERNLRAIEGLEVGDI